MLLLFLFPFGLKHFDNLAFPLMVLLSEFGAIHSLTESGLILPLLSETYSKLLNVYFIVLFKAGSSKAKGRVGDG